MGGKRTFAALGFLLPSSGRCLLKSENMSPWTTEFKPLEAIPGADFTEDLHAMLQQFKTSCSDVINLKGHYRRGSELSSLGFGSEDFENLSFRDLQDRYPAFVNYDRGQADDL